MKRFLAFLLMFCLLISVFSINTFAAANEEFLTNYGFEDGTITGYKPMGNVSYEVGSAYAHDGSYGLLIKNRTSKYATYYQDITEKIKESGAGVYRASMWVKLKDAIQTEVSSILVIRFQRPNPNPVPGETYIYEYFVSNKVTLSTSWQKCLFEGYLEIPDDIVSVAIYQQSYYDEVSGPDVCVDSISMTKLYDVSFDSDITDVERTPDTTVGAIRWDAWYSHDGKANSVVSQVERSLSPAEFHFRAPFFAEITGEDSLVMPEYTQDIFDREMEYAMYAGIDYFAYVWYNSDMKMARKFHEQSQYRNDVKMCCCFDGNAINQPYAREEMRTLLQQDYYMTVLDGRPLMYYYTSTNSTAKVIEDIIYYEELCEELGLKKPFAVILNVDSTIAKGSGGSAVSRYAYGGSTGIPFAELAENCQNGWLTYNNNKFQYVPNITAGWHAYPRYVNPVSWTKVSADSWVQYATNEEILDHFAYGLSYLQHDEVKAYTKANTMLAYAWNEHDEGGWICPTLEVDENGNQLYNEDGTKKINESRIIAVKEAIDFFKSGNLVEVTVNGVSNGSTIKSASATIDNLSEKLSANVFEGISYESRIAKIKGATLDIGSSLTLNYYVDTLLTDDMTMRFTSSSGKVTEVNGKYKDGYSIFSYEGINPQCMSDTIKAELLYNGTVIDTIENYSVKEYCNNIISNINDFSYSKEQRNALKTLLADMLEYGAESQIYQNYNKTNLANTYDWVEEYKSTFTKPVNVKSVSGNTDANNKVKSIGLNMANVNKIYYKFILTDDVKITLNNVEIDKAELIKNADGTYSYYTDGIYATGFDDVYTLRLIKNDATISTVKYSVNSYVNVKAGDSKVGNIAKALSTYGASAKAFAKSLAPDNNFDLEDDIL